MSGKYLKHAKIDAFGAFSNRVVGPFGPHLNVVFGQNEAGKTTLSQFVGGVLFGWEEARGLRNTYKPEKASSHPRFRVEHNKQPSLRRSCLDAK